MKDTQELSRIRQAFCVSARNSRARGKRYNFQRYDRNQLSNNTLSFFSGPLLTSENLEKVDQIVELKYEKTVKD
jgi:hypothetical protein